MERFKYLIMKERDFSTTLEMTGVTCHCEESPRNRRRDGVGISGDTFMSFRAKSRNLWRHIHVVSSEVEKSQFFNVFSMVKFIIHKLLKDKKDKHYEKNIE